MRAFGRWLQIAALILLPLAMLMQLTGGLGRGLGVSEMLIILVFAVAMFCAGRLLEGYTGTT